jgi:hypothetical protein
MNKTSVQTAPNPQPPAAEAAPAPAPRPRLQHPLYRALKSLASLRLTVVLFVLSLLLVFFGTLAQIDSGMWTVVSAYFRSWVVVVPFQLFVRFGQVFFWLPRDLTIPGAFPFPAGHTLGVLLLVNLLAAHSVRFKISWKRSGILLIHAGLIFLMLGEFLTGQFSVEGSMTIDEGSSTNVVEHHRYSELAVVDTSGRTANVETVVPGKLLKKGGTVRHDLLPFDVEVVKYMVNSRLVDLSPSGAEENLATHGSGRVHRAVDKAETSGVDQRQTVEMPSAYLKLTGKDGKELGTYLFSLFLKPQRITVGGKPYEVALRFQRTYKPYSMHLIKFSFDRYKGTQTAKNFSSLVRLQDPDRGQDREVLIRMNEPLFYRGDTLYQQTFDETTEKTTVLQVVRNFWWFMPYWSCGLVAAGMLVHFGISLVTFLRRGVA